MVKKGRKDNTYTLKTGNDGFPILLDHTKMDSDIKKAAIQAFLNWHYCESVQVNMLDDLTAITENYSGKLKDPVPWKVVIPRKDKLIPPLYLSDGLKIWKPLKMNQHKVTKLLDFWYERQQNCRNIVFEFYG